ncbi:MAG: hypothetical protein EBR86_14090 [Planctomycetia bacterium]|nr:hypothetical protein [Planctomycetia bacterium]
MTAVALSALVLWMNLSWRPGPGLLPPLGQRLAVATFLSFVFSLVHPGPLTRHALMSDVRRRPRFWLVAGTVFVAYIGSAYLPDVFRRWRLPSRQAAGPAGVQPNS